MGVTAFQRRVYDATRQIPRGRVMTYGELARRAGLRGRRAAPSWTRRLAAYYKGRISFFFHAAGRRVH